MSIYHSKSSYHPVSELPGSLPNGSHLLPGNGYYSVAGRLQTMRYDYSVPLSDPKLKYSQHWRINALNSINDLKKNTSLPKYYTYYPQLDSARDRYIFVPKFRSREQNALTHHEGFNHFKNLANEESEYHLNRITSLPPSDHYSLPEQNISNDLYRDYNKPQRPYDMVTLRDTNMYRTPYTREALLKDRTFVTTTSAVPRP